MIEFCLFIGVKVEWVCIYNFECWDSNGLTTLTRFPCETPGQDWRHLASQWFNNPDCHRGVISAVLSKILLVATYTSSGPMAVLMAGEQRGCFLKAEGNITSDSARKSFLCSYVLLISASKQRKVHVERISDLCENMAFTFWPARLNSNLRSYSMNAARKKKKMERKLAFLSHGLQRILGSLFSSVKMITESLACSGLPWGPEVSSPIHSLPLICAFRK